MAAQARGRVKVLHVCSGYAQQTLYNDLVSMLDEKFGVEQFVYVPVRTRQELDRHRNRSLKKTEFRYSHILRKYHRVLFGRKIATVRQDLLSAVEPSAFDVAHAHFLFSDGAVALKLRQQHGLRYLVAVRNTDINFFMKYRPDLLPLGREILRHAEAVVFLNPVYRDRLLDRMPAELREPLAGKCHVIPNGIDTQWLHDGSPRKTYDGERLRLLFVGGFTKNKNVPTTLRAAEMIASEAEVQLTLVGAGGDGEQEVDDLLATGRYPWATRTGRIDDRERLMRAYRDHDLFVMPSHRETFGLTYVEALSQGLPVVHSVGQGVDGYFPPGTVAEAADPGDAGSVASAISALAARLPAIRDRKSVV